METKIQLKTADVCLLIALCESAGLMTSDAERFKTIANKLREQTGLKHINDNQRVHTQTGYCCQERQHRGRDNGKG